ncbi:hypothetical protein KP509_29G044200 [Ceratopteris richardii]|uniref:DUF4200 domain-containing protein n=1 Tax=Ceratopteris richardii TaxID=49495 RepID=A0A8T2R8S3_CERRI|nr:hypothetical protein KP509_29G044200 [Ceratopteris richardii]
MQESKTRTTAMLQENKMATTAMLENALPATRLLEKCRLMFQVQEALENKKIEFAKKEEALKKREDDLRLKDRELQESLIGFSKFLQENNTKRIRAEKKSLDEARIQQEKEVEIRDLEANLEELQKEKATAKLTLERMMAYQKYLEHVLDVTQQYHEINDLLLRHSTLSSNCDDLTKHIEECTDDVEKIRADLQAYRKASHDEILSLENDIRAAKLTHEKKKKETAEIQQRLDSILEVAASKTLTHGQVCMAAENLFSRVCRCSTINHPDHTSPLRQLDVVGDYITDIYQMIRNCKGSNLRSTV